MRLLLAAVTVFVTLAAGAFAQEPAPDLTPRQVVEAQLAAMQHNDQPDADAGIRTAFRFASPSNRETTGPVERFIEMVKQPGYDALLNHRQSSLSDTTRKGDQARIKVHLIDSDGKEAAFVWILSKQHGAPWKGCWMTDSVFRVDIGNSPFQVAWNLPRSWG